MGGEQVREAPAGELKTGWMLFQCFIFPSVEETSAVEFPIVNLIPNQLIIERALANAPEIDMPAYVVLRKSRA